MLNETIKQYRRAKGLSQEELAIKLNVVRQTVSKWEKGISVPDSQMLIRIAECLDVPVSALLGQAEESDPSEEWKVLAAKLEVLNEQFAKSAERKRKIWRGVSLVLAIIAGWTILELMIVYLPILFAVSKESYTTSIIGGADGPTTITVVGPLMHLRLILPPVVLGAVATIGIVKTKRKE